MNSSGTGILGVTVNRTNNDGTTEAFTVFGNYTVDATELGDIVNMTGASSRVGRESASETNEPSAVLTSADRSIEAFTYAIPIRDYGANVAWNGTADASGTGVPPADYDSHRYILPWIYYMNYTNIFRDNFDGDQLGTAPDNFSISGKVFITNETYASSSPFSMNLSASPSRGVASHNWDENKTGNLLAVEFNFTADSVSGEEFEIRLADSSGKVAVNISIKDGDIRAYNGNSFETGLGSHGANSWVHIKVWVNNASRNDGGTAQKSFILFINGNRLAKKLEREATGAIENLSFTAIGTGARYSIDDVKIYAPFLTNWTDDPETDSKDGFVQYGWHPNSSATNKFEYSQLFINWPNLGSDLGFDQDIYNGCSARSIKNYVEANASERDCLYKKAKNLSIGLLFYVKDNEPAAKTWGLNKIIFTSADQFPFIPYFRESRRMWGTKTLFEQNISQEIAANQIAQRGALMTDGIAIFDARAMHPTQADPVTGNSHGGFKDQDAKDVYPFQVPAGALISNSTGGLVAGEKGISVTHIVNAATRLQPAITQIGQAAGALAAFAAKWRIDAKQLDILSVQKSLLDAGDGDMLFFYQDSSEEAFLTHFKGIQVLSLDGAFPLDKVSAPYYFNASHPLNRSEMAVILSRVANLDISSPPGCGSESFTDVPCTSWAYNETEAIYAAGITGGCAAGEFCPGNRIRRDQMATFVVKTYSAVGQPLPEASRNGSEIFTDVTSGSTHDKDIGKIYMAGITAGCQSSPPQYCPANNLTRAEISTMLYRGFYNSVPMQTVPDINSTLGTFGSNENLTCGNRTSFDPDSEAVRNIFNWFKDNQSFLVLHMPFDTMGKNATDYSGYGNNGSSSGDIAWNRTGKVGGAYVFDGFDDNITIQDANSLDLANALTLEAWIYKHNETSFFAGIIRKAQPETASAWNYMLRENDKGNMTVTLRNTTGDTVTLTTTGAIPVREWHHIAATYNGSLTRLYLDGKTNTSSSALTGPLRTYGYPVVIGDARTPSSRRHFNGSIDEVRIYNRALSPEQIAAHANLEYEKIVSQETGTGESWRCQAIPNDFRSDGRLLNSTSKTIS